MFTSVITLLALVILTSPALGQETQTITILTNRNLDSTDKVIPFNKETTEFFQYLKKETNAVSYTHLTLPTIYSV